MRKAKPSGIERLESYLVKLIVERGDDENRPFSTRFLLGVLKGFSVVFGAVVAVRYFLYLIFV